jgi:hypothetical protein
MEKMKHDYVDIPALPQPLQELHWERQAIALKIGEAALRVTLAYTEYNDLISQHIQMNELIRIAEGAQ